MASSEDLGAERSIELSAGTIRYRERGEGPPVVFVHGLLVNADLWRGVVPAVAAAGHRCLAPDWPLGSHSVPMKRDADLSPTGLARLIAEFLEALDLTDVTVVANDTGGGLTQILMTRYPERIGRVVLTPSDAFELFPPPPFNLMVRMLRLPGATWLSARLMQIKALRPAMFGVLVRRPVPDEIMASYLTPCRRDAGIRRDLRSVGTQVHRRHTLAAAAALPEFTKPVLLAWAEDEKLFRGIDKRLLEVLPDARVVEIADSRTLVPEDQPDRLAELIIEFTGGRNADRLTAHPTGSLRGDSDGPDGDGPRAVR